MPKKFNLADAFKKNQSSSCKSDRKRMFIMDDVKYILSMVDAESREYFDIELAKECKLKYLLRSALSNRLLYTFARSLMENESLENEELCVLKPIVDLGNNWMARFNKTLEFLNRYLGYKNFIVIKSFKYIQDITYDVDVALINDNLDNYYEGLLEEEGFKLKAIHAGHAYSPSHKMYMTIDIYKGMYNDDKIIIDDAFIKRTLREYTYKDNKYLVPNSEAELLLNLSQINFQNRFITISDFLQITKSINKEKIDWSLMQDAVSRNKWIKSFSNTISIINSLYSKLYGEPLDIPMRPAANINPKFPFFISPLSIISYDLEILGAHSFRKRIIKDMTYILYQYNCKYIKRRLPMYEDWIQLDKL